MPDAAGVTPEVTLQYQTARAHQPGRPGEHGRLADSRRSRKSPKDLVRARRPGTRQLAPGHRACRRSRAPLNGEVVVDAGFPPRPAASGLFETFHLGLDLPPQVALHAAAESGQIEFDPLIGPPCRILVNLSGRQGTADLCGQPLQVLRRVGVSHEAAPGWVRGIVGEVTRRGVCIHPPRQVAAPAGSSRRGGGGRSAVRGLQQPVDDLLVGGRGLVLDAPAGRRRASPGRRPRPGGRSVSPARPGPRRPGRESAGGGSATAARCRRDDTSAGTHPGGRESGREQDVEFVSGNARGQRPPAVAAAEECDEVGPGRRALAAADLLEADREGLLIAAGLFADAPAQIHRLEAGAAPAAEVCRRGKTSAWRALRSTPKSLNVALMKTRKSCSAVAMRVPGRKPRVGHSSGSRKWPTASLGVRGRLREEDFITFRGRGASCQGRAQELACVGPTHVRRTGTCSTRLAHASM